MKRLDGLVALLQQFITSGYCQSLFELLLAKGKATLQTYVGLPHEDANIHDDLVVGYEQGVYETMNNDTTRNDYFRNESPFTQDKREDVYEELDAY